MITSKSLTDGMTVLSVEVSRIDAAISMSFKEKARQLMHPQKGRIIVDLANVEFLDSSGLGTLVAMMKMLDDGRRLELANCGTVVSKVLALTRMDSIFVLHDTVPAPPERSGLPGKTQAGTDSQDAA